MKKYINLLPVILLVASFLSAFVNYNYVVIGNLFGYSISTNLLFILYFSTNKKFCSLIRLSPIGLILMNVVDIVGFYFDDNFYNFWYVVSISSVVFFLSFLFYIQKIFK